VWAHPDNVTICVYLSTFEDSGNDSGYMNALAAGIAAGQARGLSRVLFDFTSNGGGDICWGTAVLRYLFGASGDPILSPTDMPPPTLPLLWQRLPPRKITVRHEHPPSLCWSLH
jgi:hypothetical protein